MASKERFGIGTQTPNQSILYKTSPNHEEGCLLRSARDRRRSRTPGPRRFPLRLTRLPDLDGLYEERAVASGASLNEGLIRARVRQISKKVH